MLIAQVVTEAEYEQALGEIRRLVAWSPIVAPWPGIGWKR